MNTTLDIFPASLLIARSSAPIAETAETQSLETAPEAASDTSKSAFPLDAIGALFVLMIALALVGLWSWTLVEFLRFFVETLPQPSGFGIVLQ